MNQIQEEKLLVRMVFVGPYLDEVVDYLELSGSSYLVLSFAPSVLTIDHSLVPLIVTMRLLHASG